MASFVKTAGRKRIHGFTLVELLLAMAISIFLIGGVVLIQTSSRAASIEAERLSRIQENIRFTSDLLVRDIRNAGFRDQLSLTPPQFAQIGTPFAEIVTADGNETLEIRYAGWGSCEDGFNVVSDTTSPSVVRNQYFVDGGELRCAGSSDGTAPSTPGVGLASGLNSVDYSLMCVSGNAPPYTFDENCTRCDLWTEGSNFSGERTSLSQACYGVRIDLEFDSVDAAAGAPPVSVELNATFRNVLLGQQMWQAVCQIVPKPSVCET